MARSIRSAQLETRTARLKLPITTDPSFVKVGDGIALGYRRNRTDGAWVARVADGSGRNARRNLAIADDYQEADGQRVLSYWQAVDAARRLKAGDTGAVVTVRDALDAYAAALERRGRDDGNVSRVRRHMTDALADKPIGLVKSREWERWRNAVAAKVTKATVNRILHNLKAALNAAADHDQNLNRHAWRVGLASFSGAEQPRNVIRDEVTVLSLVDAAYRESHEFGLLVEVAAMTGARAGQLRQLQVQDLLEGREGPRLTVPVSAKGNTKVEKRGHDSAPITDGLAAKLKVASVGRPRTAPLLVRPSGEPWSRGDQRKPFMRAAKAAGEDPRQVTMYALRHSSIVRMILANVPIRIVADHHDTSVLMIERNYSQLIGQHSDALVRGALLDTKIAPADVVPLRR
jgi:integrase